MPSWDSRDSASTDDDDKDASGTNNYYYNDDKDDDDSVALVVTALVCFLGGIFTATFLFMYAMPKVARAAPGAGTAASPQMHREVFSSTSNAIDNDKL